MEEDYDYAFSGWKGINQDEWVGLNKNYQHHHQVWL